MHEGLNCTAFKFEDKDGKEILKWVGKEEKPYKSYAIPEGETLVGVYGIKENVISDFGFVAAVYT